MFKHESDFLKYTYVGCGDITFADNINEIIDSEKMCSSCCDVTSNSKLDHYKKRYMEYLSDVTAVSKTATMEYITNLVNDVKVFIVTLESMVINSGGYFIMLIKNLKTALANLIKRVNISMEIK